MDIMRVVFPGLMVLGALGSMVMNLIERGSGAITLQWIGAALLYTALLMRNTGR